MDQNEERAAHEPNGKQSDANPTLSRRDFTGSLGIAALAAAFPNVSWLPLGREVHTGKVSAEAVSYDSVTLEDGGTRVTAVVRYHNLPGEGASIAGWTGQQRVVWTKRPTSQGDVIEVQLSMDPAIPTADGKLNVTTSTLRYEFIHGPTKGDLREDTMLIHEEWGGRVHRAKTTVMRPINPPKLSPAEQLRYFVEAKNDKRELAHNAIPGALHVTGPYVVGE